MEMASEPGLNIHKTIQGDFSQCSQSQDKKKEKKLRNRALILLCTNKIY